MSDAGGHTANQQAASPDMKLPISGQFSETELREAVSLNLRTVQRLSLLALATVLIVLVLGVISSDDPRTGLVSAIPILILGLLLSYPLLLPRVQATRMANGPLGRHPLKGKITAEAISWLAADFDLSLRWEELRDRRMTETMVLLYQPNGMFTPLPRLLFQNDSDWRTFTEFVARRLPPRDGWKTKWALVAALILAGAIVAYAGYQAFIV